MNIIKFKDKIKENDEHFNKAFKGKYAYCVNWRWCIPFDNITYPEYIKISQDNSLIDRGPHKIDYILYEDYTDKYDEWGYIKEEGYIDNTITLDINDIEKWETLNKYTTDENITIDEVKVFRTWLAQYLLDFDSRIINPIPPDKPGTTGLTAIGVDLGLPSQRLWANVNLGAFAEEEVGDLYQWAGVSGHYSSYEFGYTGSPYAGVTGWEKYTQDGATYLDVVDNVVLAQLGASWTIPTQDDIQELLDNTYQSQAIVNGVTCTKFMNRMDDSKYIVVPNYGYIDGVTGSTPNVYLWSKNKVTYTDVESGATAVAAQLIIGESGATIGLPRWCGMPIRPVTVGMTGESGVTGVTESPYDKYVRTVVDLNLPSGNKWCTCNIGGQTFVDEGEFFMYAGQTGHAREDDEFNFMKQNDRLWSEDEQEYTRYTAYSDGLKVLRQEDDTANLLLGPDFYTPTKEDFDELIANTGQTYVLVPDGKGGYTEYVKFTSNDQLDKYIILPANVGLRIPSKEKRSGNTAIEVDLGLPNGTKWSSFNLGAHSEGEIGKYYYWAGLEGHEQGYTFSKDDAPYCEPIIGFTGITGETGTTYIVGYTWTKYGVDGLAKMDQYDDAAFQDLGNGWRMPTIEDWEELNNNTYQELIGATGIRFKNKNNSNQYIDLPRCGICGGGTCTNPLWAWYWTADKSIDNDNQAIMLVYPAWGTTGSIGVVGRFWGLPIRPVKSYGVSGSTFAHDEYMDDKKAFYLSATQEDWPNTKKPGYKIDSLMIGTTGMTGHTYTMLTGWTAVIGESGIVTGETKAVYGDFWYENNMQVIGPSIELHNRSNGYLLRPIRRRRPKVQKYSLYDDDTTHMLEYYANKMYDDVCKYLSVFGVQGITSTLVSTEKKTCACQQTSTLLGLYSVNNCDTLAIYRENIKKKMINTFSEIDFWTKYPAEFLIDMKRYIENIINLNLPLYKSCSTDYTDCGCLSSQNASQQESINILKDMVTTLGYMIDNDLTSHKNFMSDTLIKWSTYLYELMEWNITSN